MEYNLNGTWQFRECGTELWRDAVVPGCNYLDLMRNGVIPDPFLDTNEKDAYWVALKDWEYRRDFDIPAETLQTEKVLLRAELLDTVCDIFINGKPVGSGKNAHLLYEFDIKPYLFVGKNDITVRFFSPVDYVKAKQKICRAPLNDNGLNGITHIRKPQCHFGWDWGPVLTPSGISGDIKIVTYDKARIKDIKIAQTHADGKVKLDVSAEVDCFGGKSVGWALELIAPNGGILRAKGDTKGEANASFDIENPELWWTHELSDKKEQPLYDVVFTLTDGDAVLDKCEKSVGLRTLILDRSKDEYGENCRFILNGVPLFIKGANWIPADSFINRVDEAKLRYYIDAMLFSNMNMLRIWGGGYYGSDTLYDLCDRFGILIWQDFQFACQAYPFFLEDFAANVRDEVEYNVKRLRHRASLALWCGNNEIEQCTAAWRYRVKFVRWTEKYFYHILPALVSNFDGVTAYIPGSSYGSAFLKDVGADNVGDTHLWEVWHGLQPMTYYRKRYTRFCSEFGFESLPDHKTVIRFAGEGEHSLESEVFNAHQKCRSGNLKMVYYISTRFRLPENFEDYIYLSQITQQECVKDATEHWRRNRGRCNGSMYWQLNDCWPVCSWSSIDYYGNYKALQYTARHFNAPFTLSIENYSDRAYIYLINDTAKNIDCSASYKLMRFDGEILLKGATEAKADALCSKPLFYLDPDTLKGIKDIRNIVLAAELYANGERLCRKTALFAPERDINLPTANVTKEVSVDGGKAVIKLSSDKFARLVCVYSSTNTLPFSDNFFDILPGETVTVTQPLDKEYTAEKLTATYTVKSVSGIKSSENAENLRKLKLRVFSKPRNFVMMLIYKLKIK